MLSEEPALSLLAHVLEAREQPLIQHSFPVDAVEPLHVGVLRGLTRLNLLERYAVALTPGDERPAGELRAMVRPEPLGFAPHEHELVQHSRDAL